MKLYLLTLAFFMSSAALANPFKGFGETLPKPLKRYFGQSHQKCLLLLITNEKFYEETVVVKAKKGSHGGAEMNFKFDSNALAVIADGKWMGANWERNGEVVAEGLSVTTNGAMGSRVLIVYNPKDREEYMSISCDPFDPKTDKK